ncbi:hypothetical protein UH38_09140 [Aliterella atlantica CENA595]|uniref:Short-chain dehydrogenase n=1 Tax=Aliterella atlantica CENA595 TaxID=1618023 RepID=A0A0D8ZXF7_9CYAN|nr:hypothetical protein [Aliterella atlantica]KJH71891.1 hypothetical protein UH38_09140 [Aliterella atlantica CENA595]
MSQAALRELVTQLQNVLQLLRQKSFWQAEIRKAKIPLKLAGQPDEVAEVVFSFAICSYATGQIIEVDGGWTAS